MATVKKPAKKMQMGGDTTMMKKGGTMAKNGKKFPDLNKDGKITKADILKGRGVIAKKGTKVKKAQNGWDAIKEKASKAKGIGETYGPAVNKLKKALSSESIKKTYKPLIDKIKATKMTPKNKMGGKTKKCEYGCK